MPIQGRAWPRAAYIACQRHSFVGGGRCKLLANHKKHLPSCPCTLVKCGMPDEFNFLLNPALRMAIYYPTQQIAMVSMFQQVHSRGFLNLPWAAVGCRCPIVFPSLSPFMISFLGRSWLPLPGCFSKLVSLHDFLSGLLLAAAAALSPKLVSLHDFPWKAWSL